MYIAVDFDGSVVTHEYPKVGRDIGAVPTLKKLIDRKHQIILFTMRSGKELNDAVRWFKDNDIPLFGINYNPTQTWTTSPKAHAQVYIDDAALFMPLIHQKVGRPYIDWEKVEQELKERGIL